MLPERGCGLELRGGPDEPGINETGQDILDWLRVRPLQRAGVRKNRCRCLSD